MKYVPKAVINILSYISVFPFGLSHESLISYTVNIFSLKFNLVIRQWNLFFLSVPCKFP